MSKREKINAEEKIRIAKACTKGTINLNAAAEQQGVHPSVVDNWVRQYQSEGIGAFLPRERNRRHDPMLKGAKMKQSMSRVAKCIDNGPMEGFWGILKRERYYGKRFTSRQELVQMIEYYITYYNNRRVQRNLGVLTPMKKHYSYPLTAQKDFRQPKPGHRKQENFYFISLST